MSFLEDVTLANESPTLKSTKSGFLSSVVFDEPSKKLTLLKQQEAVAKQKETEANSLSGLLKGTLSETGSRFAQIGKDFGSALVTPPAPKSLDMQESLQGGWEVLSTTLQDTSKKFQDFGTAWTTPVGGLKKTIATGEAGMAVLNNLFALPSAFIKSAQGIPVIGYIADGVNNLFSALGAGGSGVADSAVDALPASQQTKETIRPLAREIGALTAQIVGGKLGADGIAKVAEKSKQIMETIDTELQGVRAYVETGPVRQLTVSGETPRQRVPVSTPQQRYAEYLKEQGYEGYKPEADLPTIQIGTKPKETLPSIQEGAALDRPLTMNDLSATEKTTVISNARKIDAVKAKPDWQASLDTALARFQAEKGSSAKTSVYEPIKGGFLDSVVKPEAPISPKTPSTAPIVPRINEVPVQTSEATKMASESKPIEPVGTGGTKTSKLALGIEQNAIEAGLTTKFGKLPEYQTVNLKEQAQLAVDLIKQNVEEAMSVAMGEKLPPRGLLPEMVLDAMERTALKKGNVEMLLRLANSKLASEATAMGQRIRALGERDQNSPVKVMQDVRGAREKSYEKTHGKKVTQAKKEVKDAINKEMKKASSKRQDWNEFIKDLTCGIE